MSEGPLPCPCGTRRFPIIAHHQAYRYLLLRSLSGGHGSQELWGSNPWPITMPPQLNLVQSSTVRKMLLLPDLRDGLPGNNDTSPVCIGATHEPTRKELHGRASLKRRFAKPRNDGSSQQERELIVAYSTILSDLTSRS